MSGSEAPVSHPSPPPPLLMSTELATEATEANAANSAASLGMEQKPHEAAGKEEEEEEEEEALLAVNDSNQQSAAATVIDTTAAKTAADIAVTEDHHNSGTPTLPQPQSKTDIDIDIDNHHNHTSTNNDNLPLNPTPTIAQPDAVDPIAPTTAVITTTSSGPILHSSDKPEQLAAAILAATSSEIHAATDTPPPEPALELEGEITSEILASAPETAEDPALQQATNVGTGASCIANPASLHSSIASSTPQTIVTPSSFIQNTPENPSSVSGLPPPAVAATLGSIAPPLLQYSTEPLGRPTSPGHLITLNDLTEPITPLATKFSPSNIMVQSQTEESLPEAEYLQLLGLRTIRRFLKVRTSYDVLPMSFRLIVLDNNLLIKKSLNILIQNAIVSAPLWDAATSTFAGLLTATDYINVIQYYCLFPEEMGALEHFKLANLRSIENAIGVSQIEDVSVKPTKPLYQALRKMLQTRARRIPLVDIDEETGRETVISVITQYRILKFIAVNNEMNTVLLRKSIKEIGLGTYTDLVTLSMDNTVLDAVHFMVQHNISSIPIVDENNRVLNVFEAVDIIPCIQGGIYEELSEDIGTALCKRADESPGIYTCSEEDRLDSIFDTIRKSRVHRLVVVDDDTKLRGIISLSDILKYVLLHGEETDNLYGEEEDEQEINRQNQIAARYTQPQQK
ncbi:5'-AMP-activated protein kinase subunit gamma [Ceratocystis fimbriata CBS 114723]|uniref:5'-AMP-activated protein kinase subunit gamma n=1 Tax=Ceratocystis fimbriata CBS 114723 TaxID=1035309 RepID=A0A2C5WXD2_9PEZI|nr:5'-AMP-activated protein kinase subunit gamma [Ceratocystis fimbriata CBS 114723]